MIVLPAVQLWLLAMAVAGALYATFARPTNPALLGMQEANLNALGVSEPGAVTPYILSYYITTLSLAGLFPLLQLIFTLARWRLAVWIVLGLALSYALSRPSLPFFVVASLVLSLRSDVKEYMSRPSGGPALTG
ncbi:MAG: hypothetical protein ACYC8T_18535 [Myxococcaceae bacterium]